MKIKDFGQVFTPQQIVNDILDCADYHGKNILNKHIIDNSCGDGAFLLEIIDRYIDAYKQKHGSINNVELELKTYIHGIELDDDVYLSCVENVKKKFISLGLPNAQIDLVHGDAMEQNQYDCKMDFVVGNPPYVRVHNLNDSYDKVKKYFFCANGMTDLYILFYEIGLNMLNENGVLCYISPNSFYNSLAGKNLRDYIIKNHCMEVLMDLGHYQPFTATTYTTICKLYKGKKFDKITAYKYNLETCRPEMIGHISYDHLFVDGNIVLSKNNEKYMKYLLYKVSNDDVFIVKNAFATLNDSIFIKDSFGFNDNVINILKASTGVWHKCVYPYDKQGKLIPFNQLSQKAQDYFLENRLALEKDTNDSAWYAFGRTQGIKDVSKIKYSINTCIKNTNSIKISKINANEGVYSGLYILTSKCYSDITEMLINDDFIDYLRVLNKCKSGGYYTFSSKDLAKYLNCRWRQLHE